VVESATVVPPGTTLQRSYLWPGGALSTAPPPAGGGADAIRHKVRSGADISVYLRFVATPEMLVRFIPLSSAAYDSPPLAADEHLHGTPKARLEVSSVASDWQVHVALFDVPPSGPERYVTGGFTTTRGDRPPGESTLDIDLGTASYVFRAGHRIRLRVENLAWHRPAAPAARMIRALPVFSSFVLRVLHDATHLSWVEIPRIPTP